MVVSRQKFSLNESLKNIDVISKQILLCSQTENLAESACSRQMAESVGVITDTVFALLAHVLPVQN